jgi:Domain of unknown function (DUF4389)
LEYPVSYVADYVEPRNRLTAFFRFILAIPIFIWVALYGIAAQIAVFIAWFAIVFTGRYPEGLYRFVAGFVEVEVQATGYTVLLSDPYPPFTPGSKPDYPVRMQFAGPLEKYSRLKTFFRALLAIPIVIVRYVAQLLLEITAIAAWIVSVVLGRLPRGLFDPMVLANSYIARSDAYLFLLTETYPPFQDMQTREAGLGNGAQPSLSGGPQSLQEGVPSARELQNP